MSRKGDKLGKKRSTNPFDDSSSEDDANSSISSVSNNDLTKGQEAPRRRSAPLDFNFQYPQDRDPALQFNEIQDDTPFVSPLANALAEELGLREGTTMNHNQQWPEFYHTTEESPLLPPSSRRDKNPSQPSSWTGKRQGKQSRVLTKLDLRRNDDAEPDYKMIRLENVGTAKSWMILLAPYLAVILCLVLESNSTFQISGLGPITGMGPCLGDLEANRTVPIDPSPVGPCFYQSTTLSPSASAAQPLLPIRDSGISNITGTVFESGIITTIPPSASVLFADATFLGLSVETMSAIYQGKVSVSGLLFEKSVSLADGTEKWHVVASSQTETLAMACHEDETTEPPRWVCRSPKLMEILFSTPGSAILSGNELRINILYCYNHKSLDKNLGRYYIYGNEDLYELLENEVYSGGEEKEHLMDFVQTSTYMIYHTNPLALTVDIWGRLVSIVVTLVFAIFWLQRLGCQDDGTCWNCRKAEEETSEIRRVMAFLDSPWASFPERWYILVMLISLVLIQGPLVVWIYFNPDLNTVVGLKTASDTCVGIGVNGVLFVYLCLFEGFGYHTAKKTRQWQDHRTKFAEIRRTARYVVESNGSSNGGSNQEEAILRYTADYFDKHGDTDGTATLVNLRFLHDPFGHDSADFLLAKLLLFMLGVASIWLAAYTRFHFTSDESRTISQGTLQTVNAIYLSSYLVHFSVLMVWLALIFRSSVLTGKKLRREPFLATRAAQLSYRVLSAHVALGFLTLALLFLFSLEDILKQWRGGKNSLEVEYYDDSGSRVDFWLQLIERTLQRFPYSGTASSVGLGRIFFATVSILITAFIFLPHIHQDDLGRDFSGGKGAKLNWEEEVTQRRDKRAVVSLVQSTHTWRVLPLPMERTSAVARLMLPQKFYQLYKNGKKDPDNLQDPGLVFVGKYIPVFCVEIACWLHEASFQVYYSPKSIVWNDSAPGKMNLSSAGLRLESAIFDHETNTQVIVATNSSDQSEGPEDSLIVIAFRGSVDISNIKTDLKSSMVALPDQLIGFDKAPFRVSATKLVVEDSDGWIWNTRASENHTVSCFSAADSSVATECFPFGSKKKLTPASAMSSGAMAVLSATPIARNTLPCVHEGFNEVYSVIRKKVIEALLPVLQRQMSKASGGRGNEAVGSTLDEPLVLPKIFVTGHSLGGALAQLFSLDLASNCELVVDLDRSSNGSTSAASDLFQLPTSSEATTSSSGARLIESSRPEQLYLQPPIAVYTFGQPRVGNHAFASLYKQRVPHTFRVSVEGDPVTALPQVACSGVYKPAGLEVVLDQGSTGNTLVGPTVVETLFRFHHVRTDVAAHSTDRYRDCLESALAPHELQEYYRGHISDDPVDSRLGTLKTRLPPELPDWMTQVRSSRN